jgi:hypothetical protein
MKKILIAAALIFTTGIVSLCINNNNVQSTSNAIQQTFFNYQKELASGD